jgi:hypothetical protein
MGGIEAVWRFITDKCGNPRWHEVIRLLIGSLERDESQRFVLERIIPPAEVPDLQERALLAGGCLIDRVAPAEEMAGSILRSVLMAALRTDSTEALQKPLRQLTLLGERETDLKESIAAEVSTLYRQIADPERLHLVLAVLGWSDREIRACHLAENDQPAAGRRLFDLLLASCPNADLAFTDHERDRSWFAQSSLLLSCGSPGIMSALALSSATAGDWPGAAIPSFGHLLIAILEPTESFCLLVHHATMLRPESGSRGSDAEDLEAAVREKWVRLARDRAPLLDLAVGRVLARARLLPRARARARVLDPARDLERALAGCLLAREYNWSWLRANREGSSIVLDLICETLELRPKPLWSEALRVRFFPKVPYRITLLDPDFWNRTLLAFRNGEATVAESADAAALLLLDVWFYLTSATRTREEPPFAELAERTRQSPAAELRIAHCIRDIAYGDHRRIYDLEAMVNSDDPELVRIFRRACWID